LLGSPGHLEAALFSAALQADDITWVELRRQSGHPRAGEADVNRGRGLMKRLTVGINAQYPNTQRSGQTGFAPLGKHRNLVAGFDCKIHPIPQYPEAIIASHPEIVAVFSRLKKRLFAGMGYLPYHSS
jgi:hypothetical protein